MNVEEQVATLEALLARVKKNAALPRAPHRTDVGVPLARSTGAAGSAGMPAVEPAVVAAAPVEIAPKAAPVEATPKPSPVEVAARAPEPAVVERAHKPLTTTLLGTPGMGKAAAEAAAARAAAIKAAEKVEAAKAEAAKATARPAAPKPAEPASPRPPAVAAGTTARPAGPRPPFPSRPAEATPAAPKVDIAAHEAPTVKVEPQRAPSQPDKHEIAADKPVEKVAAKPASTLKAPDENETLFNFDTDEAPPKRPAPAATKPAEKPVEKPVEKAAEKPVEKVVEKPAHAEEEELTDEETKLMVGPIPDAARPPPADEITVDDDTRIVSMPDKPVEKAAPAIAKAHDDEDEPEPEEVTRLMDTKGEGERTSAPKIEAPAHGPKVELHPPKVEVQQPKVEPAAEPKVVVERPAPKIEGEKVVVSAAARPPAKVEEPAPAPVVAPIPSAIIDDQPPEPKELTSPSRRYEPLPEPIPGVPTGGKRTPMWVLAAAAVVLLGAAAVVGLRNGWFGGGPEPVLSALPAPSNTVPAVKETASAAPAVTTTATAAVTAVEPAVSATVATSATAPADTASAATSAAAPPASASVAPATSGTAAPTAEPEGDGSALAANKGYLIVNSTNPAGVYLTGVFVGATGKKLEADCGFKFLRLGVPPADGNPRPGEVTWVSDGKSIAVGCQKTTTVTLEAGK